jgi:hypothetical protein
MGERGEHDDIGTSLAYRRIATHYMPGNTREIIRYWPRLVLKA